MQDSKKRSLIINKAFLFFFASTYVLRIIFSSVYFKQLGMSSSQTGILQGASPIAKAFGAFTFGYVADRADLRKGIFLTSVFACAVTPFLLTLPQPKELHCIHHSLRSSQVSEHSQNTDNSKAENGSLTKSDQHVTSTSKTISYDTLNPYKFYHRKFGFDLMMRFQNNLKRQKDEQREKWRRSSVNYYDNKHTNVDRHRLYPYPSRSNRSTPHIYTSVTLYDTKSFYNWTFDGSMSNLCSVLLLIIIIGDFISGPALNLSDTSIMHLLDNEKDQYGKVRLWGDIGQSILVPSVAFTVYFQKVGICGILIDDYKISLYLMSAGMFVAFLVGLKVQMPSSDQLSVHTGDIKDKETTQEFLKEFLFPLANWSLLVDAFFLGVFLSSIQTFLFWTMIDLDPSQASLSVGTANFCRTIFSIVAYYASTILLQRIGARNVINLSISTYLVPFVIVAFFRNPWLAILPEVLVYISLALSMAACVTYVSETTPERWSGTAQGKYLKFHILSALPITCMYT